MLDCGIGLGHFFPRNAHVVVALADQPVLAGPGNRRLVVVVVTEVALVPCHPVVPDMDAVEVGNCPSATRAIEPIHVVEPHPQADESGDTVVTNHPAVVLLPRGMPKHHLYSRRSGGI